jgi:hypothetical protein
MPGNSTLDVAASQSTGRGKPRGLSASAPTAVTSAEESSSRRARSTERGAVRQVLQSMAREAMAIEDRASFIRLLDSLDERTETILGLAARR